MIKNNIRKKSERLLHSVLDIIIGILCVALVGAFAYTINMIYEEYAYGYSYSEDSFYYRLEDENFGGMVEMYHANEAAGVKPTEDMQEYYGVAKYFEAASYYKLYEAEGDQTRMEYYGERMDDALQEMGELKFLEEKILEKLKYK